MKTLNRIAIFVGWYRATNETFVSNEIFYLQQSNISGDIFYEKINRNILHPVLNKIHYSSHCIHTFPFKFFLGHKLQTLITHVRLLFKNPWGYTKAIHVLLKYFSTENFFLFIRSGLIGKYLLETDTSIIYVHDGARVSIMAILTRYLTGIPCGIIFHTEYLFGDVTYLKAKLENASFSIFQSDYSKLYAINRTRVHSSVQNNMHVVSSPGIDTDFFRSSKKDTNFKDRITIISIGRLESMKGYDQLVQTVKILIKEKFEVSCHIVGYGSELANLKKMIHKYHLHKSVVLDGAMGHTKQLLELIDSSEYFILLSRINEKGDRDMQPNAVKEAMSMGKIVITPNFGGIEEVIVNGKNGFLIDSIDANKVATLIVKLTKLNSAKKTEIRNNARKTIVSEYSKQLINEKLIKLFQHYISG